MNKPDLYQQTNAISKRDTFACLEKHKHHIKWKTINNKIIDLGCGDGSVTNMLKEFLPNDYKLVGCDISEEMVAFASEHYSSDRTSFTILDIAGDIPEWLKGNFDHVFSFYALNWVIDQKKAFENIFNLLDGGGSCFLTLAAYFPFYDVYRTLSRKSKWSAWIHDVEEHISPYHDSEEPDKEIVNLMENIGFVNVKVECKDMFFVYDDEELFRKYTKAVNPFKIPEEMYGDFFEDYVRTLRDIEISRKSYTNNSLKHTLHYTLLVVYGFKPDSSEM